MRGESYRKKSKKEGYDMKTLKNNENHDSEKVGRKMRMRMKMKKKENGKERKTRERQIKDEGRSNQLR